MTDNWTIASTVATAGATIVALWVALREGINRRAERRDAEETQARLLVIRIERDEQGVAVHNYSAEPFLEVRWFDAGAKVAASGQTAVVRFDENARRIIRPLGAHAHWDIPLAQFGWGDDERPESAAPHGSELWGTVHYLDANGLWWSRTGNDRPVRLLHGPGEPVIHD
ncbi:hypothetical protein ABZ341_17045 [Streptomyces sp. NPDC006173]|uniref:hypothetical protein n=1 Tax=Streptomyces sp. NPDC006173 TaxID=3155349 RepID=UPI0033DED406